MRASRIILCSVIYYYGLKRLGFCATKLIFLRYVFSFTIAITEAADLLQSLSLVSEPEGLEVTEPAKKVASQFFIDSCQFIGNLVYVNVNIVCLGYMYY